jgi:hypothetical protein
MGTPKHLPRCTLAPSWGPFPGWGLVRGEAPRRGSASWTPSLVTVAPLRLPGGV